MAYPHLKYSGYKPELGHFRGDSNPEIWVIQAERYFTFYGFSKDSWISMPYVYFKGEARAWFDWLYRNNQFSNWEHFKEKLAIHYQDQTFSNLVEHPKLKLNIQEQGFEILCQLEDLRDAFAACATKLAARESSTMDSSLEDKNESVLLVPVSPKDDGISLEVQVLDEIPQRDPSKEPSQEVTVSIITPVFEGENTGKRTTTSTTQMLEGFVSHSASYLWNPLPYHNWTAVRIDRSLFDEMSQRDVVVLQSKGASDLSRFQQYNQFDLPDTSIHFDPTLILVSVPLRCYVDNWLDAGQEFKDDTNCMSVPTELLFTALEPLKLFPFDPGSQLDLAYLHSVIESMVAIEVFKTVDDPPDYFCEMRLPVIESKVQFPVATFDCFCYVDDVVRKSCVLIGIRLVLWDTIDSLIPHSSRGSASSAPICPPFDKVPYKLYALPDKVQEVHHNGYTFYKAIELAELADCHRLHHGLGDALVYVILLNKCVAAEWVRPVRDSIMLMFIINQNYQSCNWLKAGAIDQILFSGLSKHLSVATFYGERASKNVHQLFKVSGLENKLQTGQTGLEEMLQNAQIPPVSIALKWVVKFITSDGSQLPLKHSKLPLLLYDSLDVDNNTFIMILYANLDDEGETENSLVTRIQVAKRLYSLLGLRVNAAVNFSSCTMKYLFTLRAIWDPGVYGFAIYLFAQYKELAYTPLDEVNKFIGKAKIEVLCTFPETYEGTLDLIVRVLSLAATTVISSLPYNNQLHGQSSVILLRVNDLSLLILIYSNLEDKVLFEDGGNVMSGNSLEYIFGYPEDYLWDPG